MTNRIAIQSSVSNLEKLNGFTGLYSYAANQGNITLTGSSNNLMININNSLINFCSAAKL